MAIIDPGPDVDDHVRALSFQVRSATSVVILLTHHHGDHAGCAQKVAGATGAVVAGPPGPGVARSLGDGDHVVTDAGVLYAVHTPGHTADHLCFHWQERRAVFVGDLLLGEGDTTWVADYPGCVADYLVSLDRLRALEAEVLVPAHGPVLDDPVQALDRYERHRQARIAQVRGALAAQPSAAPADLLEPVYGRALPEGMRPAAAASLAALMEYVRSHPTAD